MFLQIQKILILTCNRTIFPLECGMSKLYILWTLCILLDDEGKITVHNAVCIIIQAADVEIFEVNRKTKIQEQLHHLLTDAH
jgi:hypothetical protein